MSRKYHRMKNMLSLMRTNLDGLTSEEMAELLNVSRQTIHNYIMQLEEEGHPIYQDGNRWCLDPDALQELHLSLAEAWFLYLPLRRIVRAELHRYPLVNTLLEQVAQLIHDDEIVEQLVPSVHDEPDPSTSSIFEVLVACWKDANHARIQYLRPNAIKPTEMTVAPWWFEPAVWTDGFYLIGGVLRQDGTHTPITLKLERIQSVRQLPSTFERPHGRDIVSRLQETWGIWNVDDEPVKVVLRFDNRHFSRLQETKWHPSQQMEVNSDGSIEWQAWISEPQEMMPWIRGWGADVEVIEPGYLRQQIAAELRDAAKRYGADIDDERSFF